MKLGACTSAKDLDCVPLIKEAGFDYCEIGINTVSDMTDCAIDAFIGTLSENGLTCEAANCFIKGGIKVVGASVDYPEIGEYLDLVLDRAQRIGIKSMVYGSGGSRTWEDGFSPEKAYEQVVIFLKEYAGPRCADRGIAIAIEPLIFKASKMIHFVAEAVKLAGDVALPNVKSLADVYHMVQNGDEVEDLLKYPDAIIHAHISNPYNRKYPFSQDEYDYKRFLDNLKAIGCRRCSIEAEKDDFETDLFKAAKLLRSIRP